MNDDQLLQEVRAWLQAEDRRAAPEPEAAARRIRARLPDVRRPRRWLMWRPSWASRASRRADRLPSSTAVAFGHGQTVTGRTSLMFSPGKIIVVGFTALAIGGALAVARPFSDPAEPAPGAVDVAPLAAPVAFTGSGTVDSCEVPATTDVEGPVAHTRGESCGPAYSFSDPRLDGTITWSSNVDEYVDDSGLLISSVAMSIENEEGAWRMLPILTAAAPGSLEYDPRRQAFLVGEGAYAGLVAVLDGFGRDEVNGFILEGQLPPAPENAHQDQP